MSRSQGFIRDTVIERPGALAGFFFGLILLGIGVYPTILGVILKQNGAVAEGTVVQPTEVLIVFTTVEYSLPDGRTVRAIVQKNKRGMTEGEAMRIRYHPSHPSIAIEDKRDAVGLGWIFIGLIILLSCALNLCLYGADSQIPGPGT